MTKNTPFCNFACFCTPNRCTRVHCLVLKNDPNYVNFFYADDIQLKIQVAPRANITCPHQQTENCILTLKWPRYFYSRWCPRGFLGPVAAPEIFCGASRGQNAFLRGQKSTNLPKMADFDHFFLLTGRKWGAEPQTGGEGNAPCSSPPPPWCRHCLGPIENHFPTGILQWNWHHIGLSMPYKTYNSAKNK